MLEFATSFKAMKFLSAIQKPWLENNLL